MTITSMFTAAVLAVALFACGQQGAESESQVDVVSDPKPASATEPHKWFPQLQEGRCDDSLLAEFEAFAERFVALNAETGATPPISAGSYRIRLIDGIEPPMCTGHILADVEIGDVVQFFLGVLRIRGDGLMGQGPPPYLVYSFELTSEGPIFRNVQGGFLDSESTLSRLADSDLENASDFAQRFDALQSLTLKAAGSLVRSAQDDIQR